MSAPRRLKVTEPRPSVRDAYLPSWAYLRQMAAQSLIAGDKDSYLDLSKLASHVRNEWTEPRR